MRWRLAPRGAGSACSDLHVLGFRDGPEPGPIALWGRRRRIQLCLLPRAADHDLQLLRHRGINVRRHLK